MMDQDLSRILDRDFSEEFVTLMRGSMLQSHYKYGWVSDTYPELADAIESLKMRIEKYEQTGNKDFLIDIANFAMIEFMQPKHPKSHFRRTSSDESPGLAGMSSMELQDGWKSEYYRNRD